MLILQTLSLGPAHGYAIAQRIQQVSREVVQVNQGSLYPALHRLEQKRWLKSAWRQSETGRDAKFYAITRAGQKQLAAEKETWDRGELTRWRNCSICCRGADAAWNGSWNASSTITWSGASTTCGDPARPTPTPGGRRRSNSAGSPRCARRCAKPGSGDGSTTSIATSGTRSAR